MMNPPVLLIADDEEMVVDVLCRELEPLGYRILTAHNGKEALEKVLTEAPDAILSDIQMPKMDGLSLLNEIRQKGISTPLIFLTALGDKEKAITALRLGAIDFLEKPFARESLRASVKRAIQLGLALRDIDSELDIITQNSKLPEKEKQDLRERKKAVLIVKKLEEVDDQIKREDEEK